MPSDDWVAELPIKTKSTPTPWPRLLPSAGRHRLGAVARLSIDRAHCDVIAQPRGRGVSGAPGGLGPCDAGPRRWPRIAPGPPRAGPGLVHGEVDLRSRAVHQLALSGSRGFGAGTAPTPGAPAPAAPAARPRGGCDRARLSGQHRPPRLCCPAPAAPGGVSLPPPARAGARPTSSGRSGRRCAPAPCGSPPAPAAAAESGTCQHRWGRGTASISVTSLCHPRR